MISVDYEVFKSTVNEIISTNPIVLATRQDVEVLKEDVRVLKEDVRGLKEDVKSLKESVFHQGVVQEEMRHHLQLILEAVVPAQKRAERLEQVEDRVERHEMRLTAVENAIKANRSGATP